MRRACIVFNPASGNGDASRRESLQQLLAGSFELQLLETSIERDADTLAKEALETKPDLIVAAGGDGTVSAVASALVNTTVPLGILPLGTACSLAMALGVPKDLDSACLCLSSGQPWTIDTARVNGRTMVMCASLGVYADTITSTARDLKNRWGVLAYVATGLQKLSDPESFEVELELDDATIRCTAAAVTIANLVPRRTVLALGPSEVLADDGLLDATLVAGGSLAEVVTAGIHLLRTTAQGEAATRDGVGYFSFRRLRIKTNPPMHLLLDGEDAGIPPFEVVCVPKSLTVIVPELPESTSTGEEAKLDGMPDLSIEAKAPLDPTSPLEQ